MSNTVESTALKAYIERIERLEREKREADEMIREVFAEAKGNGFAVDAMKRLLKRRAKDAGLQAEQAAMDELYEEACR